MSEQTYYELLQVRDDANKEVIQASYRRLSKMFHPDNTQTGDAQKFKELAVAFEVLSSDVDRNAYDRELTKSVEAFSGTNYTVEKQSLNLNSKKRSASFASKSIEIFVSILKMIIMTPITIIFFLWNFVRMFVMLTITWIVGKGIFIFASTLLLIIIDTIRYRFKIGIIKSGWELTERYQEKIQHFLFPKYPINYNWEWIAILVLALILAFVETKDPDFA